MTLPQADSLIFQTHHIQKKRKKRKGGTVEIDYGLVDFGNITLLADTDGTRHLKNYGSLNNADVYSGRGYEFNSVDMSFDTSPIGVSTIYTLDGVVTYITSSLDITTILPNGVYSNIIWFNTTLTQAEQDAYLNNPETFAYNAINASKVVSWLPMTMNDKHEVDLVNYSEGVELYINSDFSNLLVGWTAIQDVSIASGVVTLDGTTNTSLLTQTVLFNGFVIVDLGEVTDVNLTPELMNENGARLAIIKEGIGKYILNLNNERVYVRARSGQIVSITKFSVKQVSGVHEIQNFLQSNSTSQSNKGLQCSKLERDSLGMVTGLSANLEFNKDSKITIPSHTETVNIEIEVYPRELVGNILSGSISYPASGLIQDQWQTINLTNQNITSTIDLGVGFNGIIRKYKETLS